MHPGRCELNIKGVYYVWGTCTSPSGPQKFDLVGRGGQSLTKNCLNLAREPSRGPEMGQGGDHLGSYSEIGPPKP